MSFELCLCLQTFSLPLPKRPVGGCDPAVWHPCAAELERRDPQLCRQRQSRHFAGQRQRTILRVHAEGGSQPGRGPPSAGRRDAAKGKRMIRWREHLEVFHRVDRRLSGLTFSF